MKGPTTATTISIVSHCPRCGHYSTTLGPDMVAHKQYALDEIRMALEGSDDYCMASERTRRYWRAQTRGMLDAVARKIRLYIDRILSLAEVESLLVGHLESLGDRWLRALLDLFHVNFNNLCRFVTVVRPIIAKGGGRTQALGGSAHAPAPGREAKPP